MCLRKFVNPLLLIITLVCFHTDITANTSGDQFTIFDNDIQVELIIEADFKYLIDNREIIALPAKVRITAGDTICDLEATIEVRGNFRRDARNCDFPPLRLRFEERTINGTLLEGNDNLKIVTHCKEGSKQFQQFIAREYTTYQLYNVLSPYSLKVKMVDVTYIDVNGGLEPIEDQAFLIEDIDNLARMNWMTEFEGKVNENEIERANLLRVSVFQYMIGNSDWIIEFSKNLKFLKGDENMLIIPYDFDYTAMVGADYTIGGRGTYLYPPERIYKGPCFELNELQAEFEYLRDRRDELIEVITESPYLKSGSKSGMKNYIIEFFGIINSDEQVTKNFFVNCN